MNKESFPSPLFSSSSPNLTAHRLSIPTPSTPVRQPSNSPALQGISPHKFPISSNDKKDSKSHNTAHKFPISSNDTKFSLENKQYGYDVHEFEYKLRRAKKYGSSACAIDTCRLLRSVLHKGRFETWGSLLSSIQFIGEKLVRARPLELVIGNIVKRLLFIIRREHRYWTKLQAKKNELLAEKQSKGKKYQTLNTQKLELNEQDIFQQDETLNPSILDIFHAREERNFDLDKFNNKKDKSTIINELNDLMEEIETTYQSIEEYSVEHIHSNELILTYGYSKTVYHFLKYAAKYRSFEVFVCESAPSLHGQSMANDLVKEAEKHKTDKNFNIKSVTLISDSSIFAIMSRVNKVIIGTHAVFANGGLLAHSGTHGLALAAQFYSVPIVVVSGLYKLSTLYAYDQDTFNEHDAPSKLIKYEQMSQLSDNVSISNPVFDYLPPEYIDIFLTNAGGHAPSYMYRLLSEYYDTTEDRL
eukprot:164201_1